MRPTFVIAGLDAAIIVLMNEGPILAEWYGDMEVDGAVSTSKPKPNWQPGWRAQHDRS